MSIDEYESLQRFDRIKLSFDRPKVRRPKRANDKDQLRRLLPEVGARLIRPMVIYDTKLIRQEPTPTECTVIYVNRPHLFYVVQFDGYGFRQTFSVKAGEVE